jgi:LacI family transcriptional regulator
MQARVRAAADRLKYQPNAAARVLAGSRSYVVGLYLDNPSPAYVTAIQIGALAHSRAAGFQLMIEALGAGAPCPGPSIREQLAAVRMDGVILSPPLCDDPEVLDALDDAAVPYVRISPTQQLQRSPYVFMDERRAAREMTEYLIAQGHADIAFIKGPEAHAAAAQRFQGFRDAMSSAGLDIHPAWVQRGAFSFRSGFTCAERLFAGDARPTAVFAGNDDMALGVMAVALRQNLALPGDLSVVGFDDTPSAQVVWPQLTTVRQPVADMAAAAAELLISGHGPKAALGRRLDFSVIVRGSAGPPRACQEGLKRCAGRYS